MFKIIFLISVSFLCYACKDKPTTEDISFDRATILTNIADHFVATGYADFKVEINLLDQKWNAYLTEQSSENFGSLQSQWKVANLNFQRICMFDFGPATDINLCNSMGIFPCDTALIKSNISTGTYTINASSNANAVGFDALDYLLFRADAKNKIDLSSNVKMYVSDLISKMKTEINYVASNWSNYRATFVNGADQSSTGGFALLVNGFSKEFETTKNAKLGIPLGIQSLGILQMNYLEARRSGFGKELYSESMKTLHAIFKGEKAGATSIGFDDYLNKIEREDLSNTLLTRFAFISNETTTWTNSFENMMMNQFSILNNHYNYVQATVPFLKSDMASAFGVLITYQDNDGD